MRRMSLAALAVASLLLATSPALAAAGGKGQSAAGSSGKGSIVLVPLNPTPGGPYFGDQVTFTVSTSATASPWVNVNCYRNSTWVYGEWHGFFASYRYGQTFTLGPTNLWQSGSADCTAALVNRDGGHARTLATISFHVAA
jgi:hypothetical protein